MSDELAAQAHALLERLFALLPDCRAVVPQLEAVAHRPGAVSAQAERLLYFASVGEALSVAEAAGRLNIALATFYASGLGNDERAINGALVARLLAVTSTSDLEHLSNPETTAIEVENIAGLIGRYSERYLNGLWEALTKLLVKWTPHLRPGQPAPPATNVIILNERVRQRQLAAMEVPAPRAGVMAAIPRADGAWNVGAHLGLSDSDAQVLYFVASLLLTGVLVIVAIYYAVQNRRMAQEMRWQNELATQPIVAAKHRRGSCCRNDSRGRAADHQERRDGIGPLCPSITSS